MYRRLNQETGPFDLIGDVHGCCDELQHLLHQLGYAIADERPGDGLNSGPVYRHPAGRKAIFLGDLVDRGPCILDTLRLVYTMTETGNGFCVIGNHDHKLMRKLKGRNVQIKHGLETTLAELERLPDASRRHFEQALLAWLEHLPNHYILDKGCLVAAHAGLKEALHGTATDHTRSFALYGQTTGAQDEYGLPVRQDWARQYHGEALVVYGHAPVPEPYWRNNTVDIDTGCIFGGKLTALRYPERQTISVPARRVYYEPPKPFPTAHSARSND